MDHPLTQALKANPTLVVEILVRGAFDMQEAGRKSPVGMQVLEAVRAEAKALLSPAAFSDFAYWGSQLYDDHNPAAGLALALEGLAAAEQLPPPTDEGEISAPVLSGCRADFNAMRAIHAAQNVGDLEAARDAHRRGKAWQARHGIQDDRYSGPDLDGAIQDWEPRKVSEHG